MDTLIGRALKHQAWGQRDVLALLQRPDQIILPKLPHHRAG
ncbi:MAG TPA: hypothetical protein VLK82_19815 [Candidatus Tectomicrobia bacterium]|nr:hypothetical protein [Candidatus Tectomicrobia bacterium]